MTFDNELLVIEGTVRPRNYKSMLPLAVRLFLKIERRDSHKLSKAQLDIQYFKLQYSWVCVRA